MYIYVTNCKPICVTNCFPKSFQTQVFYESKFTSPCLSFWPQVQRFLLTSVPMETSNRIDNILDKNFPFCP